MRKQTNPNQKTAQKCCDYEKQGKTEKLPLIGKKKLGDMND